MASERSDAELAGRARDLIESDDSLHIRELRVDAQAGVLQLGGVTHDEGHKRRAGLLAKSVKGHSAVANDIQVRPSEGGRVGASERTGDGAVGGPPEGWAENDGRKTYRPRAGASGDGDAASGRDDWSSRFPDEIAGGAERPGGTVERPRPSRIEGPVDPEPDPRPGDLPPGEIRS